MFEIPDSDRALLEKYQTYRRRRAAGWRSLILAGYLPYWVPQLRRFCWDASPALLDEWQRAEVGLKDERGSSEPLSHDMT
jgi:hypothetical protein